MFAFVNYNRQRALNEIERRRGDVGTYTLPLDHAPPDMRDFLLDFYKNVIFKQQNELKEELNKYPQTVGKFHQQLVQQTKQVSAEDFWQRYLYRTQNIDRVLKELLDADEKRKQQRAAARQGAFPFMGGSGKKKKNQPASGNDDVIFASQQGDHDSDGAAAGAVAAVEEKWVQFPPFPKVNDSTTNNTNQQQQPFQPNDKDDKDDETPFDEIAPEPVSLQETNDNNNALSLGPETGTVETPPDDKQEPASVDTTTETPEAPIDTTIETQEEITLVQDITTAIEITEQVTPMPEKEAQVQEPLLGNPDPTEPETNVAAQPQDNNNAESTCTTPTIPIVLDTTVPDMIENSNHDEGKIHMIDTSSFPPDISAVATTTSGSTSSNTATTRCLACDMDSEFVPDGMVTCNKCDTAHYCSSDCRQWHWKQGGHAKSCIAAATAAAEARGGGDNTDTVVAPSWTSDTHVRFVATTSDTDMDHQDSDDESIDPLEAFKTWGGRVSFVDALRRAREEHAEKMFQSTPVLNYVQDDAKSKRDFVENMSKSTPVLFVDLDESDKEEEEEEEETEAVVEKEEENLDDEAPKQQQEEEEPGEQKVNDFAHVVSEQQQSAPKEKFGMVHMYLLTIIVTVIAAVLLALNPQWTVAMGDALCAPVFPFQKLSSDRHVVLGTAPWWIPGEDNANLKREAFHLVCGMDRKQTMLEWSEAKNPRDGFELTITNMALPEQDEKKKKKKKKKNNNKPLLTLKRIQTIRILPSRLEVVPLKMASGETVQAPWIKN